MRLVFVIFLVIIPILAVGQSTGVSGVLSWQFGSNTDFGQQAEFFPANVLGFPADSVSAEIPSANPADVVSLGLGGWIILKFEKGIQNGPGVDFVVFENVFWPGGDSTRAWREPGIVSVSFDGKDFVTFPHDSVTLSGCAGLRPTNAAYPPDQFPMGGGDGFDLELVKHETVRFVKIEDRSRWVRAGSGFDLDAVISLYPVVTSVSNTDETPESQLVISNYPNPFNPTTTIRWNSADGGVLTWQVVSLTGQRILSGQSASGRDGMFTLTMNGVSSGTYLFIADDGRRRTIMPMTLLK